MCLQSGPFPPKARYGLALTLAGTVLQLHATPWLDQRWAIEDVHVACETDSISVHEHTYLSRLFNVPDTPRGNLSERHFIANESIFALGLVLLELSYGERVTNMWEHGDSREPDYKEWSTATRLVKSIRTREPRRYSDVVQRCVLGRLSPISLDLNDVDVQQIFYEDIVVPLQELYNFM